MNTEAMEPRPAMLIASGPPAAGFTRADVGGKGWNLFRLARAGFPVPPWTVVTSGVFELVIAPHRDAIDRILRNITDDRKESLEAASSAIADLIHGTPLPPGLRREILDGPGPALSPGRRYSVRSSVIGEDSAGHSYAGLMTTRLNVPRDGIIGALREVWASAFSARAILYRRAKGLGLSGISSAVIIQEMVTPATSGVVFSRDPERRTQECVVAAGYGLGEGVVSDAVETDSYRADWSGNEVRSSVTVKTRSVVAMTGAGGGTRVVPVTGDRTFRPVLGDGQVLLLRDMAVSIEKEFGAPQDIEWAFDGEGRPFILQARPIVFPERAQDGPVRIWDNSNIVESYPGITLPLTFSFIRTCYEETFRAAAEGFVLFRSTLRPHLHIFPEMVGLIQGRVYYNLLNWYEMLSLLPGFERHRKSWDQMIGITARVPFPEKRIPLPHRAVAAVVMIFRLLDVRGNARRFFRRFTGVYERYRRADIASMDGRELAGLYNELRDRLLTAWQPTLYNDFCAMKYYDWLKALCDRWLPPEHAGIHNQLLCGEEGIESVEPVHSAVRIAVTVRSTPHMKELFSGRDDRRIWDAIRTDPRYDTLRGACEEHLDRYGDRGTEELKLEKATLAERPEMLVTLIKRYAGLGLTVDAMKTRESSVRTAAENALRLNLRNPLRAVIFRFILTRARRAVANRENMRFARSRAYGLVRRIFRRLGQILAKEGLIHGAPDVNYLTVGEVFGIIDGTATTLNLRGLVALRKREYRVFATLNPAERIVTRGIPSTGPGTAAPPAGPGKGELRGTGCSSGIVRGTARVLPDPGSGNGESGYILVARSTDPGWVFLMISSKGIIVEKGSVLSHTAIIGRELGIPTIIGVRDATSLIRDGSDVEMDGSSGRILCR